MNVSLQHPYKTKALTKHVRKKRKKLWRQMLRTAGPEKRKWIRAGYGTSEQWLMKPQNLENIESSHDSNDPLSWQ